jgi:hypothetical protein
MAGVSRILRPFRWAVPDDGHVTGISTIVRANATDASTNDRAVQ